MTYEFHEIEHRLPQVVREGLLAGQACEGKQFNDETGALNICGFWPSVRYPGYFYGKHWSSSEAHNLVVTERPFSPPGIAWWIINIKMDGVDVKWEVTEAYTTEYNPSDPIDRTSHKGRDTIIYFIEAVGSGCVKIGRGADRISSLQTGCPFRLRVIAEMFGPESLEKSLHSRFAKHRVRGEWFNFTPEISEYLRGIKEDEHVIAYNHD